MRWHWLLFVAVLAVAPASAISGSAEGIRPGEHFTVPFIVDGERAINRATVILGQNGRAQLRVLYVRGRTIQEAVYGLERLDDPTPGPVPPIPDPPDPDPDPDPEPNPYTPADEWLPVVEPLSKFQLAEADARAMANLYATAAAQSAAGAISTTLELRQWLVEHGVKLGLQGKYPSLADTMDTIQATALGLDVRPLNGQRAAAYLETLAWACWEVGQ